MESSQDLTPKANILVVDDTPDNIRLLSTILTNQGYEVRKALNGKSALTTIQKFPPDLILLDVMMPEMNGYEVCQHLKSLPDLCNIPVIFLSALDDPSDKVKAFESGGVDYITKPFQDREILARVSNHLVIQDQQNKLKQCIERLQIEVEERKRTQLALQISQKKADHLLSNILPPPIVEILKKGEISAAEKFDSATVLFADIVDFTSLCLQISPLELVNFLNRIFSEFDCLTEKYGLEKIKTIGDAYMVAGGLPIRRDNHLLAMADMALEMQEVIQNISREIHQPLQLRVGIDTGMVVAGVIGTKKFIYDLWGDTVNTASRMESLGLPGYIQVTSAVYESLKHLYHFQERGVIEVKGKGTMVTYWLMGKQ